LGALQPAAIKVPVQAHFGKLDTMKVRLQGTQPKHPLLVTN
jgi:hypothetical protein